ncbi:hypothetical protein sS8_1981 [Methylocaldum marinum]|uniref:Uncharacterized protein n=1 Tax=Methylocaldum marinum TaxID=1432792 RepID=A0A250KQJ0_9GAMM|nr:hypothetical protein sS8_1981 [Methylocaldum marinum]
MTDAEGVPSRIEDTGPLLARQRMEICDDEFRNEKNSNRFQSSTRRLLRFDERHAVLLQ